MSVTTSNRTKTSTSTQSQTNRYLHNLKDPINNLLVLLSTSCRKKYILLVVPDTSGNSKCFSKGLLCNSSGNGFSPDEYYTPDPSTGEIVLHGKGIMRYFNSDIIPLNTPFDHATLILFDEQHDVLSTEEEQCRQIIKDQLRDLIERPAETVNLLAEEPALVPAGVAVNNRDAHVNELSDYKHALDESSIVAITDQKGVIKYVNDKFCTISKYSREELLGQDHRIINSGYHSKEFIRNIWTTIANGNIWKGDIKNRAKDGSYYWVDTSIVPFLDANGKPYQYLAIRSDITQAKIAEEKINSLNQTLTSNEQRFRALIENSNDIISLLDDHYQTIFQSASATRITGWTLEDLQHISRFDHVHPDDKEQAENVMAFAMQQPGKPYPIRYRKLHKNGNYIWLEGTTTNLLNNPALNGIIINLRDVTERIESEALLQDKSKQMSDILERIQDGFITLDTEYRYTYANHRIGEMTGYDPEYLLGKNVWEVFPDAVGSQTQKAITHAFETQRYTSNIDYYPQLELWQENHIYPSPEGLAIFIKDISHQKHAEEELKQLNGILSFHITNSPLASMEFDNNFIITNWSPQAEHLFGWTKQEAIGNHFLDLNMVHKDELERTAPVVAKLLDGTLDRYHMSNRNLAKDGRLINCEWYTSVLKDEHGKPVSIMSLAQDVNERVHAEEALRKSEEKYRALIKEAVDGIMVYDPVKKQFTEANKRMAELLGTSTEQLLNMSAEELLSDGTTNFDALEKRLAGGNEALKIEKQFDTPNGDSISLEISVKQLPDNNYLAFARDITHRKKHEDAIRQLNESLEGMVAERTIQLETANKDLEAFSYSVSHDLRAPLRAVNGYASILEEDYCNILDAEGNRLLREVQENAKKMGVLIDDLLTFSRLGRKAVNTTLINMNGLCITAFDEVQEPLKSKVEFIINPLHNAMADYALIKQVMINLLSNAVKYSSKSDKPVIEVGSAMNASEVIFSVKDNGVGFDMKYVNKLFGVFQRLHSTDEFEGTGVGLATVQRVVKKHGGNVWAEGKEGRGAIFYFSLPIN